MASSEKSLVSKTRRQGAGLVKLAFSPGSLDPSLDTSPASLKRKFKDEDNKDHDLFILGYRPQNQSFPHSLLSSSPSTSSQSVHSSPSYHPPAGPGSSQELPIDLTDRQPRRIEQPRHIRKPKDIIDLTKEPQTQSQVSSPSIGLPDLWEVRRQTCRLTLEPVARPSKPSLPIEVDSLVVNTIVYKVGDSVELHDGNFLYIERIVENRENQCFHGRHLVSTESEEVKAFVPTHKDEVIWFAHIHKPYSMHEIKCFRPIVFTNMRRRDWALHQKSAADERLTCRLKFSPMFRPVLPHQSNRSRTALEEKEFVVEYLTFDEATSDRLRAKELRERWRGCNETIPFGAAELPSGPEGPLDPADLQALGHDRTYTYGDAYCGAGGASCGAKKAGLALTWAVDMDKNAMETYRQNFPESLAEHSAFDQFITQRPAELRIDVCHTSPPCQPFSPAHTIHNQVRDELNSSCIFTSLNLMEKARPRVLTMEETFGLQNRHIPTFNRLIMDFIEVGYSVRWAVLDCVNYGVPQTRRRLIILAAGPGETLPNMPPPTHGPFGSGLKPFETIFRAISGIPEGWPDHDVGSQKDRTKNAHRAPYNEHQPAKTITCSGGEANYHPAGVRAFTPREVACLQTFPLEFKFRGKHIRKQMGNAVPPRLAEAVFREVRRSLQETDERELREEARTGGRIM
ncbi:C-5 cytosine methyltransferase DmtA [Penicillium odoratum]|uniref:C-5 cytosine methyltransferase DmtA n=1 Tax=Penicillium odoratum TaxID=1167516 RepID=UPI00254829D9|nr:C-5 cytosine methyltransferase DmtA [Penicillium odoratum]KAJ5769027.1 C-5 cytosine methyltransferase DmtA [Penicillium odoratum]